MKCQRIKRITPYQTRPPTAGKGGNNKQPVTNSKATGKLQPKRTTKIAAPTQQENNNNEDNKL